MNTEFQKLIDSVGAASEILRLFYNSLIKQGFTKQEALYLTGNYLKAVFGK